LLQELQEVKKAKVLTKADRQRLDEEFTKVRQAVARHEHRQGIPKRLLALAGEHPPYAALLEAERLLKEEEATTPGLRTQPDIAAALDKLYQAHAASVVYQAKPSPDPLAPASEEGEPGLLFYPLVKGTPGGASAGGPIVLAVARGVLYALDQGNGQVRWAMRVGVDTTNLPVRVPASESSAERILVLSSDTDTLSALDRDGNTLWRYRLSQPCLG